MHTGFLSVVMPYGVGANYLVAFRGLPLIHYWLLVLDFPYSGRRDGKGVDERVSKIALHFFLA
jgi:hypothetical protein